jgi:hypothetical protein
MLAAAARLSILEVHGRAAGRRMVRETYEVVVAGEEAGSSYWIGAVLRPPSPVVTCKRRTCRWGCCCCVSPWPNRLPKPTLECSEINQIEINQKSWLIENRKSTLHCSEINRIDGKIGCFPTLHTDRDRDLAHTMLPAASLICPRPRAIRRHLLPHLTHLRGGPAAHRLGLLVAAEGGRAE